MCKNDWSGPEYNHQLEGSVDIKPGGTWDNRHQKRNLSRRLITIIVCDHYDTTVTDPKGHNKLYGKNSNQMDSLVQTVWNYSEDIGMKFGIDKCAG